MVYSHDSDELIVDGVHDAVSADAPAMVFTCMEGVSR
jgi:hypothetical protein